LAAACLFALASPSFAAQVRFDGVLTYTNVQNCASLLARSRFNSVYYPSNLGDNDDFTAISTVSPFAANGYRRQGGRFSSGFQTVTAAEVSTSPSAYLARVRLISSSPSGANLTPQTNSVLLVGQIENAEEDPGANGKKCVVTFRASYVRRLEAGGN
jgi:hypothetical protein